MTQSTPKDPHVELRSIYKGIKNIMLDVKEQQAVWKVLDRLALRMKAVERNLPEPPANT